MDVESLETLKGTVDHINSTVMPQVLGRVDSLRQDIKADVAALLSPIQAIASRVNGTLDRVNKLLDKLEADGINISL